jgi:hypothetical protein
MPRWIPCPLDLKQSNISHPPKVVEQDAPRRVADAEYKTVLTPKKSQDELFQQELAMAVDATRYFSWRDALQK